MPRRAGRLAVAFASLGATACQPADPGTAGCEISQEVTAASSPLMLLANARLDPVGSAFVLTGADADGATARWATFDPASAAVGPERAFALPVGDAGPWLRPSSEKTPGDTLLVAVAVVAANGADAELHVVAASSNASSPTAPPLGPPVAVVPGGFANGVMPQVALGASRGGPHAVLAWLDPTAGAVTALVLSAAGEPIGAPFVIEKAPAFGCLAFAPGKSALTLVYHRYADTTTRVPDFVITELTEVGAVDGTLALVLDTHAADCPVLTPTDAGYAIAFHDAEGAWLGVYEATGNTLTINPFAPAVAFGGAAFQPPLAALAPMGGDFATILARLHGGDLWRLSPGGPPRAGHLALPSLDGAIGGISAWPDSGILTATYADYSTVTNDVGTAGQRYFLRLSCR
jgi:hypothetical protein